MSKFFIGEDTVRIDFPDGEWVDIKAEFTQEDHDAILARMIQTNITQDKGGAQTDVRMDLGKQVTLERAIVAWSFKEDEPIPITPANISNLRNKYRSRVLEEIDQLNTDASDFAKN